MGTTAYRYVVWISADLVWTVRAGYAMCLFEANSEDPVMLGWFSSFDVIDGE